MERAKLERALDWMKGCEFGNGETNASLAIVCEAAAAYLATLPEPANWVVLHRDAHSGKPSICQWSANPYLTEADAKARATKWASDYPGHRYVAVEVSP